MLSPFFDFFIFQTNLDKNCGKNQEFLLPPIINVILGHAVLEAWRQQHWNWWRGFFSEVGCVMQKNNIFAKIFFPGLLVEGLGSRVPPMGPRTRMKTPKWRVLGPGSHVWIPGSESRFPGSTFPPCIYQNTERKEGCSCNLYIIARNEAF